MARGFVDDALLKSRLSLFFFFWHGTYPAFIARSLYFLPHPFQTHGAMTAQRDAHGQASVGSTGATTAKRRGPSIGYALTSHNGSSSSSALLHYIFTQGVRLAMYNAVLKGYMHSLEMRCVALSLDPSPVCAIARPLPCPLHVPLATVPGWRTCPTPVVLQTSTPTTCFLHS